MDTGYDATLRLLYADQVLWIVRTDDPDDVEWLEQILLPSEPRYYKSMQSSGALFHDASYAVFRHMTRPLSMPSCRLTLHSGPQVWSHACRLMSSTHAVQAKDLLTITDGLPQIDTTSS